MQEPVPAELELVPEAGQSILLVLVLQGRSNLLVEPLRVHAGRRGSRPTLTQLQERLAPALLKSAC